MDKSVQINYKPNRETSVQLLVVRTVYVVYTAFDISGLAYFAIMEILLYNVQIVIKQTSALFHIVLVSLANTYCFLKS